MRPVEVALFLRKRWIRPTGNWRPAFAEREIGFFLSPVCARENEQSSAGRRRAERVGARETQRVRTDASAAAQAHAWRRRCPCFAARRSLAPSRRIFERGRAARCAVLRAARRRRGARRGAPPPTHLALAALAALATLARHDEECVCVLCTLCGPLRRACSWSSACGAVRHARVAAPALCRFAAREMRRLAARARPARDEPAAMRARPPAFPRNGDTRAPPPRARRVFQFFARARPGRTKTAELRARGARGTAARTRAFEHAAPADPRSESAAPPARRARGGSPSKRTPRGGGSPPFRRDTRAQSESAIKHTARTRSDLRAYGRAGLVKTIGTNMHARSRSRVRPAPARAARARRALAGQAGHCGALEGVWVEVRVKTPPHLNVW